MRISALEGCRVALWGWGRESRAAYRAFRAAFPKQSLTLFCTIAEATEVQALTDPVLSIETEVSVPRLAAFDVVIKSPRHQSLLSAGCCCYRCGSAFYWRYPIVVCSARRCGWRGSWCRVRHWD